MRRKNKNRHPMMAQKRVDKRTNIGATSLKWQYMAKKHQQRKNGSIKKKEIPKVKKRFLKP
jgi:hypothetical protein